MFEEGVIEYHEHLKQQILLPENEGVNTHNSLQSLSSSFEDLYQRYKQLREDGAKKVDVSA